MKLSRLVSFSTTKARVAGILLSAALIGVFPWQVTAASQDQVLEWIGILNDTTIAAGSSPLITVRNVALVSASVFDAVNGIEPRYHPLHVKPAAPPHASPRAAAIQAAYAMMIRLYATQTASLTTHRDASIAAIEKPGNAASIQSGVA